MVHSTCVYFYFSLTYIRDNSCEINLMDAVEKKDVRADNFDKGSFQEAETPAGRYAVKLRKACARYF